MHKNGMDIKRLGSYKILTKDKQAIMKTLVCKKLLPMVPVGFNWTLLSTCDAKFDDSVSPTELGRDVIHLLEPQMNMKF